MRTPFRIGSVIEPGDYIEPRKSDLTFVAQCILNGESLAVSGEPRVGKTSLLTYILSPIVMRGLTSVSKEWRLLFQYMDYHLFRDENFTQKEFWQHSLSPLREILDNKLYLPVDMAYKRWQTEQTSFTLSNLFATMTKHKLRLVLCVDEFDDVLSHPILGGVPFLGSLRALTTMQPSLTMIISSRLSIQDLNARANPELHHAGSPFFNHFVQMILGCFSSDSAGLLLSRAQETFTDRDKSLLIFMTGYHPYFIQIGAGALWDQYHIYHQTDPQIRFSEVWKNLRVQALATLDDSWSFWNTRIKQVFAIIALQDAPRLLRTRTFDTKMLIEELSACTNELMFLELRGYIMKNKDGKYIIGSHLLLYWMAMKLDASIRSGDELGSWLMKEQRGAVLKPKHREKIVELGRTLAQALDANKDLFLRVILEQVMK
jgi:hypothetical protein